MTAHELRLHLADSHRQPTRGLMWAELVDLHDTAHKRYDVAHTHDDERIVPSTSPR